MGRAGRSAGALEAQPALDRGGENEVALDLGFPANLQPLHVWIDGGATGKLTCELTNARPSDETFTIKVFVFVWAGGAYVDLRDTLKTLARAVEDALSSDGFTAVVPSWSIPTFSLDAGTEDAKRSLALALSVECQCW